MDVIMRTIITSAVFGLITTAALAQETASPLAEQFEPKKENYDLPLVFSEDFEAGNANRWEPTDKSAWTVKDQGGNKVYALIKKRSDFTPRVRSPYNRSLVKDVEVRDFVMDVKLQSTHPDYAHRDLCLFFGYQNDSHLYYVHFGKKTDDHANQIFIVNGSDRKKISTKTTPGTNWDNEWHHARIARHAKSGGIAVFFDDMQTPVMTAKDKTFTSGRIGVGSFDDTGQFDHVTIYGNKPRPPLGKVQGAITLNGRPLEGAKVMFNPKDGRFKAMAITDENGRYHLTTFDLNDGALLGTNQVFISIKHRGQEQLPAKYNAESSLKAEVKNGNNEFDFELED